MLTSIIAAAVVGLIMQGLEYITEKWGKPAVKFPWGWILWGTVSLVILELHRWLK